MTMPQARPKRASAKVAANRLLFGDDQVDRAVEDQFGAADDDRAVRLERLDLVLKARQNGLARELETLKQREDPRAPELEPVVAALAERAQRLRLLAAQAQLAPPPPDEAATTVHGHVLDAELAPVSGASVYLVDAKDRRVRGISAATDDNGYFVLEYTPPASAEAAAELRVRVATPSESRVLGQQAAARRLLPGAVEYTEIVLG